MSIEEMIFQSTDWRECSVFEKYRVWVVGRSMDGSSVSVQVSNFRPYFYIKLPEGVDTGTAKGFILSQLPTGKVSEGFDVKIRFMVKKDIWGFRGDRQEGMFALISFANKLGFLIAKRDLGAGSGIHGAAKEAYKRGYRLYESNLEPMTRLIHTLRIKPCGSCRIDPTIKEVRPGSKSTKADHEYHVDYNQIGPYEYNKVFPIRIASFDIETSSSHGEFPSARKRFVRQGSEILLDWERLDGRKKTAEELERILEESLNNTDFKVNTQIKMRTIANSLVSQLNGAEPEEVSQSLMSIMGYSPEEYPVNGDNCIQIGLTINTLGKDVDRRILFTLHKGDGCERIDGVEIREFMCEKDLIVTFMNCLVGEEQIDVLTGYNTWGFDWEFIVDRMTELGIGERNDDTKRTEMQGVDLEEMTKIRGIRPSYIEKRLSSSALGDNVLKFVDIPGIAQFDLLKFVQKEFNLDSYKLNNVSQHFLKDKKEDLSAERMFALWKSGKPEEIREIGVYNIKDCVLCNKLVESLNTLQASFAMANVTLVPFMTLFTAGQTKKIQSIVLEEISKRGYVFPSIPDQPELGSFDYCTTCLKRPPKVTVVYGSIKDNGARRCIDCRLEDDINLNSFEGAIVLSPKGGKHEGGGFISEDPIAVMDFASLYPSCIRSRDFCFSTILLDSNYLPDKNDDRYRIYETSFDTFDHERKVIGTKKVTYVTRKNEDAILPSILTKLLTARKETRKRIKEKALICKCGEKHSVKEPSCDICGKADETWKEADMYDDLMKQQLDALQLAFKITANSTYGALTAPGRAPLKLRDIGQSVTAEGRKMVLLARDISEEYGGDVRYGDSVTAYTPVTVRVKGRVQSVRIDELADLYSGGSTWTPMLETPGKENKEACELSGVESWTENGWTPCRRVIRHVLAPHKRIVRVVTQSAVVDCTDDHSIVKADGEPLHANEACVGMNLLQRPIEFERAPTTDIIGMSAAKAQVLGYFFRSGRCEPSGRDPSWELDNLSDDLVEGYLALCAVAYPSYDWIVLPKFERNGMFKIEPRSKNYRGNADIVKDTLDLMQKGVQIPAEVLNGSSEVRQAFWDGMHDAEEGARECTQVTAKSQISASHICLLAQSLGFVNFSLNISGEHPETFLVTTDASSLREKSAVVKNLLTIPYSGFVYDLTTDNHHFQAGVGSLIVHNTDSVFVSWGKKSSIEDTIKTAEKVSEEINRRLPKHQEIELEKIMHPMILFTKKRYCYMSHDPLNYSPGKKGRFVAMGIQLKRRDQAPVLKDVLSGMIMCIMREEGTHKAMEYLDTFMKDMLNDKFDLDSFVTSKTLRATYKNPEMIAHKVLADRILARNQFKPQPNERIPYVHIKVQGGELLKQGDTIEHPDYIKANPEIKVNYAKYIDLISSPVCDLIALFLGEREGCYCEFPMDIENKNASSWAKVHVLGKYLELAGVKQKRTNTVPKNQPSVKRYFTTAPKSSTDTASLSGTHTATPEMDRKGTDSRLVLEDDKIVCFYGEKIVTKKIEKGRRYTTVSFGKLVRELMNDTGRIGILQIDVKGKKKVIIDFCRSVIQLFKLSVIPSKNYVYTEEILEKPNSKVILDLLWLKMKCTKIAFS